MIARVTAVVLAMVLLLPAVAAGGALCDTGSSARAGELIKQPCCCNSDTEQERSGSSSIESTCCCELNRAPAAAHAADPGLVHRPASADAALVAIAVVMDMRALTSRILAPPAAARGPPPLRSLFAQHASLIC